ncbi:MAG TPA: hypothetical protein RMF84_03215 [Polyangiaceae bacterium LLY-WYZ-14_1]|nr:hypothetical protein [Polyangiaceae bacterium LLY-WYZ-14_1]
MVKLGPIAAPSDLHSEAKCRILNYKRGNEKLGENNPSDRRVLSRPYQSQLTGCHNDQEFADDEEDDPPNDNASS